MATKCGYEGPRAVEEYMIGTIASILANDEEDTEIYPGNRIKSVEEFSARCGSPYVTPSAQSFKDWAKAQSAAA
jgi:hypothetical protein